MPSRVLLAAFALQLFTCLSILQVGAAAYAETCKASPIDQAFLMNMARQWGPGSHKKLTALLKEFDCDRNQKQLPWLNIQRGQAGREPISPLAEEKLQAIVDKVTHRGFFNEIRTSRLFSLTQYNIFNLREYDNVLPDSHLAPALTEMYLRVYSVAAVQVYIKDFVKHVFQYMQNSGDESLQQKAREGRLDHGAAVHVLKTRLKNRGIPTTQINYVGELPNSLFQRSVRKGVPIDWGLQFNYKEYSFEHGVYTHLIQFDLISDILQNYADSLGIPIQNFFDFLGTTEGNAYWYAAFDGSGMTDGTSGFTNPFAVGRAALYMRLRTPHEEEYYLKERPNYCGELLNGSPFFE